MLVSKKIGIVFSQLFLTPSLPENFFLSHKPLFQNEKQIIVHIILPNITVFSIILNTFFLERKKPDFYLI